MSPTSPVPGVLIYLALIEGRVKALLLDSCCYLLSHPLIYFRPIATDVTRIWIILPTYLPTYDLSIKSNRKLWKPYLPYYTLIYSSDFVNFIPFSLPYYLSGKKCRLYLCICVTHNFRLLNYKASLPTVLGWEKWFHWPFIFFIFVKRLSREIN